MEGIVTYGKAEWRRTLQANYLNDFLLRMSIRKVFINFGAPHFTLLCKIFSKVSTKTSSAEEYLEGFDRLWCPHFTLCTRYSCKLVLECLLLTSI